MKDSLAEKADLEKKVRDLEDDLDNSKRKLDLDLDDTDLKQDSKASEELVKFLENKPEDCMNKLTQAQMVVFI